jgi:hypothetical protein
MKLKLFNGVLLSLLCTLSNVTYAGIINQWDLNMSLLENDFIGSNKQNNDNSKMGAGLTPKGSKAWLRENSWFYLTLQDAIGLPSLSVGESGSDLFISFDFLVKGGTPEIAGIQFSDKNKEDKTRSFNLTGTQAWGIRDIEYDVSQQKWQHFDINLDQYISGSFSKIMFINDCDNPNGCGDVKAFFRNMSITQVPEPKTIAFFCIGVVWFSFYSSQQSQLKEYRLIHYRSTLYSASMTTMLLNNFSLSN